MGESQTIITKNAENTKNLGKELATSIKKGSKPHIICLYGDLGAGKTTFTQGFAAGLGLPFRLVSPTFIIEKRYEIPNTQQMFYHIDLYRINKESDMDTLGLEEIFVDPDSIVIIEWAERLGQLLPNERIDIRFSLIGNNERKVEIFYGQ